MADRSLRWRSLSTVPIWERRSARWMGNAAASRCSPAAVRQTSMTLPSWVLDRRWIKPASAIRSIRLVVAPLVKEMACPSSPAGRQQPGVRKSRMSTSNQRSDRPHSRWSRSSNACVSAAWVSRRRPKSVISVSSERSIWTPVQLGTKDSK